MGERLEKGLVQVYTGNGKGKTTAAFGQALRAQGAGLKVVVVQFLKEGTSGEVKALREAIPEIAVFSFGTGDFLLPSSSEEAHQEQCRKALDMVWETIRNNWTDVLVLDEICTVVKLGVVPEKAVLEILNSKPENMEVILTGRGATKEILEAADLVTEMQEIKHPYNSGQGARKGIEY